MIVYIRNSKAAGSTIHQVLSKAAGAWTMPLEDPPRFDLLRERLKSERIIVVWGRFAQQVMKALGPLLRDHHTVVTTIRNPYERFISSWVYCRMKKWCPPETTPAALLGMRDTISWLGWQHCHRQQVESLYCDGILLSHFVMQCERLQEDFDRLSGLLPIRCQLPRINTTDHLYWREYYKQDPDLRHQVEAVFAEDLAALPYVFEKDEGIGDPPREASVTPHSLARRPDDAASILDSMT